MDIEDAWDKAKQEAGAPPPTLVALSAEAELIARATGFATKDGVAPYVAESMEAKAEMQRRDHWHRTYRASLTGMRSHLAGSPDASTVRLIATLDANAAHGPLVKP